jgi:hypothetical protein
MPESTKELANGKYIDDQMGNGVPEGGTTGQVLAKASNTDYDTEWIAASGGSQDLQQVTDIGNTTTNDIIASGVGVNNGTYTAYIYNTNGTASFTLEIPNGTGIYTIPIKVNGISADSFGEINIPTGGSTVGFEQTFLLMGA